MLRLFVILTLATAIVACDKSNHNKPPEKRKNTLFKHQLKALKKARNVEKILRKSEKSRRKKINDQDR